MPTKPLTENDSPGGITWPRMRSAIRWMFFTRGWPAGCFVVNELTTSLTPNAAASSFVVLGA